MTTLADVHRITDFQTATKAVLQLLQERTGLSLWMMTRTEGSDWIVLQKQDVHYGIEQGTVLKWVDSFCSRMVQGHGPRVAPDSSVISAYAEAPIGQRLQIGAYVGVPVPKKDGSLFGTLCAIDPATQDEALVKDLPLFECLGGLLGMILAGELESIAHARRAERQEREAVTDAMTGLLNRRGWNVALNKEEKRAKLYGNPVAVFVIDLDALKWVNDERGHAEGDALLQRAARVVKANVREPDVVARLGGDEFGVLALDCDGEAADGLLQKLRKALKESAIEASVGKANRHPSFGISQAVAEADQRMYLEKARRCREQAYPDTHDARRSGRSVP